MAYGVRQPATHAWARSRQVEMGTTQAVIALEGFYREDILF